MDAVPPFLPSAGGGLGGLDGLVDAFIGGLRSELDGLIGVADQAELAAALVAVERVLRAGEAASATIIGDADLRDLFTVDGHRSIKGWTLATVRLSGAEVGRRVRLSRFLRRFPQVADLLQAGRLGTAQANELARAAANPRCGDLVDTVIDTLVDSAVADEYDTFQTRVRDWERLADQDGAHRDAEAAHEGRNARIVTVGDSVIVGGEFGVVQGEAMREILDAFTDTEFHADWDLAVTQYGDATCDAVLARTPRQRRADALHNIFLAAAAHGAAGAVIQPVVNIIIDQATFEQQLTDMVDPAERCRRTTGANPTPQQPGTTNRFCRTTSGAPVDPAEAVAAALIGHIRRVVIGTDGVIIDLGRRSRLFTGSARQAALLQTALDRTSRCIWPGCRHCHFEIDHATDWQHNGPTSVANSGPLCNRHNRYKTHGYTTQRDPNRHWHTHRPDGTEIHAA